jgi:hypothetical protein
MTLELAVRKYFFALPFLLSLASCQELVPSLETMESMQKGGSFNLQTPFLSGMALSSSEVQLSWQDNNSGHTGYILERAAHATGPFVEVARPLSGIVELVDQNLLPSQTYHYRMQAFKSSGKKVTYSTQSEVLTLTTLAGEVVPPVPTPTPTPPPPAPTPTPPPPSPLPTTGLLFQSDWSAARGATDLAHSDGGKWPNLWCGIGAYGNRDMVLNVVAGSQAGWTLTPNVMQVNNRGPNHCGQVEVQNAVPQGQDFYIRMYIMVQNEDRMNWHATALNAVGNIQGVPWALHMGPGRGGPSVAGQSYYPMTVITAPESNPYRSWQPNAPLPMGTWYRFEWHIQYIDVAQMRARIWPRIYNMAGELLYDANTFHSVWEPNVISSLAAYYARGGYHQFTDLNLARRFGVGYEGSGLINETLPEGRRWYYAAVEIRSDTWPGPYRP